MARLQLLCLCLVFLVCLGPPCVLFVSAGHSSRQEDRSGSVDSLWSERIKNFVKWFRHNGGYISPNVHIEPFTEYDGVGLVSTKSDDDENSEKSAYVLQQLDLLMTIPSTLMIHANDTVIKIEDWALAALEHEEDTTNVKDTKVQARELIHGNLKDIMSPFTENRQQSLLLALRMLLERCFHSTSPYAPFVDMLPSSVGSSKRLDAFEEHEWDTLLLDNIETFENLKNQVTSGRDKIQTAWQGMQDLGLWDMLVKGRRLREQVEERQQHVDASSPFCTFSWPNYLYHFGVVESRVMQLNGVHVMMPGADLVNFSPAPRPGTQTLDGEEFYPGPFSLYHVLDKNNTRYRVHSDRPVLPNQQIFEDYGYNEPDARSMAEAGGYVPTEFMEEDGIYVRTQHEVSIPVSYMWEEEDAEGYYLRNAAGPEFLPDFIWVRPDRTIGVARDAGRLAMAGMTKEDDGDDQECLKAFEKPEPDRELVRALCTRYPGFQERMNLMLRRGASKLLERAKTTVEEDLELLEALKKDGEKASKLLPSGVDPGRAALAIQLRILDKMALRHLVDSIDPDSGASVDVSRDQCKDEEEQCVVADPSSTIEVVDGSPRRVTQADIDEFNAFIESLSPVVNKVKIAFIGDSGMRVGVVAKEKINQGDVYFSLPLSAVGSAGNLTFPDNPDLTEVVRKMYHEKNYGTQLLDVLLLYERFVVGRKSRWWPYLNHVPSLEEMKSMYPFFFDNTKLEALAGSDTRRFILDYKKEVQDRFYQLSTNYDLVKAIGPSIMLDKDKYFWAYNLHNTRGITWDDESHIMPMIDDVNCNEQLDDNGNFMAPHHTFVDEETHTATQTRAARTFQAGEQIFENYATQNYVYLAHHGFVLESNSFDCALMEGLEISSEGLSKDETRAILDKLEKINIDTFKPSFCIGGYYDSLDMLANFLRVKQGGTVTRENYGVQLDVYDTMKELIEARIHRINVIEKQRASRYTKERMASLTNLERNMLRMVQKEKALFNDALRKLIMRGAKLEQARATHGR